MSATDQKICSLLLFGYVLCLLYLVQVSAATLEDRVKVLETQGAEQARVHVKQAVEIEHLNQGLTNNQAELATYKLQNEKQADTIRHLTNQVGTQAREIKLLTTELETQNDQLKTCRISNWEEFHHQKTQMKTLMEHNEARVNHSIQGRQIGEPEMTVAFHATTDRSLITHVGIKQNIILETVLLNLGNGYDNQQGFFTAPMDGVYTFSTSILSSNEAVHAEIQVEIFKNGNRLGGAYGHGDSGRHDQGAITVVTQLVHGDEVWIRTNDLIPDASYWGARFTAFSGYLIKSA